MNEEEIKSLKMRQEKYSEKTEVYMKTFYQNLSEKEKRRYAALEVEKLGYGGQQYICSILGCSPTTIRVGKEELLHGSKVAENRGRRAGGGRKKIRDKIARIDEQL